MSAPENIGGSNPLLAFGLPPDRVAWGAFGVALVWTLFELRGRGEDRRTSLETRFLRLLSRTPGVGEPWFAPALLSVVAALLSAGYVVHYLRGGPRIIDATSYFLQARALSDGLLSFEIPAPTAAFRGRFLTHPNPPDGAPVLGVIFPPGYPALLAAGFVAGIPLWVGPLIAAGLVWVSYGLALRITSDLRVARLAALISTLSAALRYHTADTMSHGWAALLFGFALWAVTGRRRLHLWGGLAAGWLVATRPLTGVVCAAVVGFVLMRRQPRSLLGFGSAMLPGLALLIAHQIALTGDWGSSTQLHYYALADGPPGCFGLGLGPHLGCRYEHGDVVERFGADGFGPLWALRNTAHRLWGHSLDIANLELIALLVPWAVVRFRRNPLASATGISFALLIGAYALFYFNGSYPGGGARFFTALLPLEHAWLALAAFTLGLARFIPPLMLAGFALHASYSHEALAAREGGRPMWETDVLESAVSSLPLETHVTEEPASPLLVFVDTDHGFNLGFDPTLHTQAAGHPYLVVRRSGDASDSLLWERLGKPVALHYQFNPFDPTSEPRVDWIPPGDLELPSTLRFEAEAQWPPLALHDAWSEPVHDATCASAGRGLLVHPTTDDAAITLELNVRKPGVHALRLGVIGAAQAGVLVEVDGKRANFARSGQDRNASCGLFELEPLLISAPRALLTLHTGTRPLRLDFIEVVSE